MKVSLSLSHPSVTDDKAPPCDVHFLEMTLQACTSMSAGFWNIVPGSSLFFTSFILLAMGAQKYLQNERKECPKVGKETNQSGEAYVTIHSYLAM